MNHHPSLVLQQNDISLRRRKHYTNMHGKQQSQSLSWIWPLLPYEIEKKIWRATSESNWSLLSKKEKEICTWSLLSKKEKRKKYALGVSLFCQKIELSKKYMRQTATSRKFSQLRSKCEKEVFNECYSASKSFFFFFAE